MNDRLQRALDGDVDTDDLTPAEVAELDETKMLLAGVLGAIPRETLPDTGRIVVQRIRDMSPPASASRESPGLARWLWSTRRVSFHLRPAYALAAAAVLAVAIGALPRDGGNAEDSARVAAAPVPAEVLVHFRLDAPNATSVSLAGDFSDWQPVHTLTRNGSGVWTIVVPLTPGVHDYSFVVDGKTWVPDPSAPAREDGFGGMNSRVAVLAPDSRRSL